jgi:hypothetical protein
MMDLAGAAAFLFAVLLLAAQHCRAIPLCVVAVPPPAATMCSFFPYFGDDAPSGLACSYEIELASLVVKCWLSVSLTPLYHVILVSCVEF